VANVERNAHVEWDGDLASGSGTVSEGSGVLTDSPVTFAARTQQPDGKPALRSLLPPPTRRATRWHFRTRSPSRATRRST
jgi:hypothetical protein